MSPLRPNGSSVQWLLDNHEAEWRWSARHSSLVNRESTASGGEERGLDIQFWLNLKNACREIIALEVVYLFNRATAEKGEKSPFPSPPQGTSPSAPHLNPPPQGGRKEGGEGFSYGRPKSQATLGLWFADGRGVAVHASEVEELKIETNHLLEGTGASLEFSVLNRQEAQELADVVKKGMVIYTREEESLAKLHREVLGCS